MPHEEHPDFETPPDETPLWRYMSFVKFVDLLERRSLFFSRADELGDPFEGSVVSNITYTTAGFENIPSTSRLADLPDDVRTIVARGNRTVVKKTFINCWYAREHDSAAMWTVYATEIDGIAIRSTVGRLKKALSQCPESVTIAAVSYIDFATAEQQGGNFLRHFLQKRLSFDHEREVRALILQFEDAPPPGLRVAVDVDSLIEEVVVAPQAAEWFADLVKTLAARYGLGTNVRYSSLSDEPWWGD